MVPNQMKFQKTQNEYNKMEEEIVKVSFATNFLRVAHFRNI